MSDVPLVFDLEGALTRVESDNAFLAELLEMFFQTLPATMESLKGTLDPLNTESMSEVAHTLKGALLNLGANKAAAVAFRLEKAARNKTITEAPALISSLEVALGEFQGETLDFINLQKITA